MRRDKLFETAVGKPLNRVDGVAKVTGTAKYAAEYKLKGLTYGVFVTSTVAKGRIQQIDSKKAEKLPGVLGVLSHLNVSRVLYKIIKGPLAPDPGEEFKLFQNDRVFFNMQPVALVVATSLEQAQYAASLVNVQYAEEAHQTDMAKRVGQAFTPYYSLDYLRGRAGSWKAAPVKIEQEYQTSLQVHNPIEPHTATAYWESDDKLLIFNKTQGVNGTRQQFAEYLGMPPENIHVHAPFVGGAFGSASRMLPHEVAAVLGARMVNRPVTVALERSQVFNMVGYRPYSLQKYAVGAGADGKLVAIEHQAWGSTASYDQFVERIVEPTKSMYDCPNLQAIYKLVPLDMSMPSPARGPGETSGSFAMESAMDELAYALKMDPLELRLQNFADLDLNKNLPWSSNYLKECYQLGAEKFGWSKRSTTPGSMKNGSLLVGMGMSAGIYKAERAPASAGVTLYADGKVQVRSSLADTGPGSATIMTQIAADALGVDVQQVSIEWADSTFPQAPPQYASHTTASAGSAVHDAAVALKKKFAALDGMEELPAAVSYTALLKKHRLEKLEVVSASKPGEESKKFSGKSFAVHFVEVHVHPLTCEVRVARVVSVIDAGKIMNPKTARNQIMGAVAWGIGIALMEEGLVDHRYGRYINNNLADYHVPVHADIPSVDIHFIDQGDGHINPMGAKGLGEIGIVGFTAAIANAVYHATGKRIRKLPITLDKLL
ncbi:MAG: xanthine dehydrogenase family protein molybdopterin-binding subunit [Williamsia sp.]|nr:xanthine dehydrogenase family protein molybdopterin-binding subunit [Williamsia sp.]